MPSPFPGMDPYLESHWGDIHTRLITYASNQLQPQLPKGLRARIEEHVSVKAEDESVHGFYPDVRVIEREPLSESERGGTAVLTVAEPLIVPMDLEPPTARELLIVDSGSGDRIITAIEFLSPANKSAEAGRHSYRRKQKEFLDAGVSLVEIDLLRDGSYVLAAPMAAVPEKFLEPYRICVVRGYRSDRAEVYRTSLTQPLPSIRIPLREGDADVRLDLQALVNQSYADGGYDEIDYRGDPHPPLRGQDAFWADALLREKGIR